MSRITYKNLNVHYTDEGVGEAVIFLHGFLLQKEMWKDVALAFKDTHRVICLDLLGHGKTENLGYIHTMEDQAKMLKFLLDTLEIKNCFLIGHSMGGYIALAFADLYPAAVSGLCLMNSTAMADDAEKRRNRDRGIAAIKHNHKTFIRVAIPSLFSEENRSAFSDEIEKITLESLRMSQQGIIASLEGMKVRNTRTHILKQDALPVLMIFGKKDPVLDYKSFQEQAKNKSVTSVILEDGHMSHIENKDELTEVLGKWFSSLTQNLE